MSKLTVEECQKLSIFDLNINVKQADTIAINNQSVQLSYSRCNYGGIRYWFLCPGCDRRVGVLYRKPLEETFFCRTCQSLTYQLIKYRRSQHELLMKVLHRAAKQKI